MTELKSQDLFQVIMAYLPSSLVLCFLLEFGLTGCEGLGLLVYMYVPVYSPCFILFSFRLPVCYTRPIYFFYNICMIRYRKKKKDGELDLIYTHMYN